MLNKCIGAISSVEAEIGLPNRLFALNAVRIGKITARGGACGFGEVGEDVAQWPTARHIDTCLLAVAAIGECSSHGCHYVFGWENKVKSEKLVIGISLWTSIFVT